MAIVVCDLSGAALSANRSWAELTGRGEETAVGLGWLDGVERSDRDGLYEAVRWVGNTGTASSRDCQMATPQGARWVRWWMQRRDSSQGPVVVLAAADIHDERVNRGELYHLATHDALTGLHNRRFFLESLDRALKRAQRSGQAVALLYLDLDGFKQVNDQAGHAVGDRILTEVAARLQTVVRSCDIPARLGGDEFAVILEGANDMVTTRLVAQRLERALAQPVDLDGRSWPLAASIGAALSDASTDTPEALLAAADVAMFEQKRRRRAQERPVEPTGTPEQEPAPAPDSNLLLLAQDLRSLIDALDEYFGRMVTTPSEPQAAK